MLRQSALKLFVIVSAAVVMLVSADVLLFTFGTWDGWRLVPSRADEDDLDRWVSHFGSAPAAYQNVGFLPPPAVPGRDGTWWHPEAGAGGDAPPNFGGIGAGDLLAYSVDAGSPVVRGRAVSSAGSRCLFEVGVALPRVMLVRSWSGSSSAPPPHPGRWTVRIVPGAMAANVAILIALIGWPVFVRDARGLIRMARGRCVRCGETLVAAQKRCSECGMWRQSLL